MIGIYLLKKENRVVYVGSSLSIETRITQHQNELKIEFDEFSAIKCSEKDLANMEGYYI